MIEEKRDAGNGSRVESLFEKIDLRNEIKAASGVGAGRRRRLKSLNNERLVARPAKRGRRRGASVGNLGRLKSLNNGAISE